VHHLVQVRVLDCRDNLLEDSSCFILAKLVFALNKIEELAFLCVLEHNEDVATCVDELEVLDDMRVVEPPQYFYFALYLFKNALQLNLSLVEYFDGDSVVCDLVYGQLDLAEGAVAEISLEPVVTNFDGQTHSILQFEVLTVM